MAQQHRLGPMPFAFLRRKQSADLRLNAQHLEEILRHRHPAEPLGFALADQQVVADAVESEVAGQIGKGAIEFPQVQQMAHLGGLAREPAGIVVGDPDQPLRFVKGQRAKQKRVNDAEYRGARADPKPDDQHGEGGESGVPAQRSKGVAQILQNAVERGHTAGIGHGRLLYYILPIGDLVTQLWGRLAIYGRLAIGLQRDCRYAATARA